MSTQRRLQTRRIDDEDALDHWSPWMARRRPRRRRYNDPAFPTQMVDDMFEDRRYTSRSRSQNPDSNITSNADAERLQVLEAVGRAKALKLCLRRIWAVASSLQDRENSLPGLIPVPGTFSIPGHDRERHEHEQCTFDFCEQSRVDFTSVAQHHETPCSGKCEQITFPLQLLEERVTNRKSTAWRVDEPSLLDASRPYMAISHVWSDGTGSGIWGPGKVNKCLYTFFSSIAKDFQCEGCWWDSISIPLDDEARTKALSSMHMNYNNSRITLVHDLYLREWEWVDSETACFAIVMSPWYSRGWTALELAQSHKVKILFKAKNHNYVIKDLDVDILAKIPESHATADAIRKLRRASIDEFGTLLAILGARDTSKPRDVPIISGLLAGVDVSGGLSQQEIYQRILRKLGRIAQGHLFHNSATMSAPGFSWCPTNILDMPMAETNSTMLTLHENGDLEGDWRVQAINSVKVEDLITRGTHPLTQVSLESAFCGENTEKHVLLLETNGPKATSHNRRALLVRLKEKEGSGKILAKFVGPVYFRAPPESAEQKGIKPPQIKVRIGSTEGLNDVVGEAWKHVETKTKENASATEEIPATEHGGLSAKSDAPPSNDGPDLRISRDWRAILFMEGVPENSWLENESRISPISKNSQVNSKDDMAMFFYRENDLDKPHRTFFYGNEGMVHSVKTWLAENSRSAKGQAIVMALGNDNTIETGMSSKQDDAKRLLEGALILAARIGNEDGTNITPLVTLLLDLQAPYHCDETGRTPLHIAIEGRNYSVVQTLLQNKSSPAPVDAKVEGKQQTALHLAAKDSNIPVVVSELLVQMSGDVNAQDEPLMRTALHYAADSGNVGMVEKLLSGSASLNTADSESQVALHLAASKGFDEIVRLLLKHVKMETSVSNSKDSMETCNVPSEHTARVTRGDTDGVSEHDSKEEPEDRNGGKVDETIPSLSGTSSERVTHSELHKNEETSYSDIKDFLEQTPLHLAAKAGHDPVLTPLRANGSNPFAETRDKETALILAAKWGNLKVVKSLLAVKKGGFQQSELDRALLMAAAEKHDAVIIELHQNGAHSNRDCVFGGRTALHWTIEAENVPSAKSLIHGQNDADIDVLDESNKQSALLMASARGMHSVVALLLEKGADINLVDSDKRTALHLAAKGAFKKAVDVLLREKYKCPVNEQDHQKRTALHYAALSQSEGVTKLIVNNKCSSCHHNVSDETGRTALDIASEIGQKAVVTILLDGGSDPKTMNDGKTGKTALERAAALGHEAVVQELLPKIEAPDLKQRALQLAAKAGNLSVAILLHKSIKNATVKASTLRTILLAAATNPRDYAIDEYWSDIEIRVDPNIQDENGRSLLMLAIENGHGKLARDLFSPRLKTDLKDKDGKTAFMVAAIENNAGMVRRLCYFGATPDLVDKKGYTALHYAVADGCFDSFLELLYLCDSNLKTTQDYQKRTALHIALEKMRQWSQCMPVESKRRRPSGIRVYIDICVELISYGIPLGIQDENGRTALHLAVSQNLEHIADILLGPRPSQSQYLDTKDGEDQTPLLLAAAKGYTSLVVLLLSHGFEPDTKDKNGQTPLLLTAEKGDGVSVKALLGHHADPNIQDKHGRTALSQAAQNGHQSIVESLLYAQGNHKTNLNARDNMGRTALIVAAENGHANIVKTLLGSKANADVVGYDGKKAWQKAVDKGHASVVKSLLSNAPIQDRQAVNEALLLASKRGWAELVEVLLEQDVDLTFQSRGDKWTALHMAAMSGHQEVLRMLIGKGVDIVIKDCDGRTALFQATEQGFQSIVGMLLERKEIKSDIDAWMGRESLLFAAEKGYDGIVKLLLDSGVDCDATDASDRTAMALAAANGKESIVKMLLERTASWSIKDKNERTALHHAAWGGYHDIVETLLAHERPVSEYSRAVDANIVGTILNKVDTSVVDNNGQSALHLAAERASLKAVAGLLNKRANVNAKCKDGQTVLHRAAWGGSFEVVRLLRTSGADPFIRDNQDKKPWHIAAEKGHETIAVELLGEEESVYDERILDQKVLIFAAKMGHTRIARCLLQKYAEATIKDKDGMTPLHWAAARGDKELAELLIRHGDVSINAVDHKRRTALCLAVMHDHTTTVELLLGRGLDADIPDEQGQTALHHAAQRGNEEIAQVLVHHNADPHIHDNKRRKAWQLAAEDGHHQVVRLLLKKEIDLGQHNQRREELFLNMSRRNFVPMVQLLLDKNVDKNVKDRLGRTAIGLAAENSSDDVLRLLLSKGANLNDADLRGQTPLLWAAKAGNAKAISLLLEKIISISGLGEKNTWGIVNHQDAEGRTALVIAIENKHDKVVKLLLDKCSMFINVNLADKMQRTALQLAAEMGNYNWVQLLLRSDAEQQHGDSLGRTALLLAAEQGHTEVMKALLKSAEKEHVNLADNQGRAPLHAATDQGDWVMVTALLRKGANPCARDKRQRSPLLLAVEHGDKVIVDLLLEKKAVQDADEDGRTPLLLAIANGDKAIVEALLDHSDVDPNAESDKAIVKALLKHPEADPGTEDTPRVSKRSLLHLAVESGNKDVAWLVLKMVTGGDDAKQDEE